MVKRILFIFLFGLFILSCNNEEKPKQININNPALDSSNFTTIQCMDTSFVFDSIKQGDKKSFTYKCLNTGNKPLVLIEVRPGCGCTIADYSKEAILPNKEGWVKANFDSKKFCGEVHKSVLVITNTSNDKERLLQFSGVITDCESNDRVVLPNPNANNN